MNFYITQILREINFLGSRSAKSAISTHLRTLNLDFYEFFHFLDVEITKLTKSTAPKMAKMAVYALLECKKLISRKI